MRTLGRLRCIALAVLVLAGAASAQKKAGHPAPGRHIRTNMRNVMYHFSDDIAAHILYLEGDLIPTKPDKMPVFDDDRSFMISIRSAEIAVSTDSLANVLNQNVFAAKDAPLKDISIEPQKDLVKVKGKLHSKGDVPFETEGTIAATPEGEIRIHTEKVRAAHLPVKGLMDLLGIKISDLINTKKLEGIRAEGDDLILTPQIFPPPKIQGKITAIRIEGNTIVQVYGSGKTSDDNIVNKDENYMSYRGAQLRFGKLTMNDTDLVLLDMDPTDPFDFKLSHYKDQLVAGYSKTTPSFGLRVYMRDFNKLRSSQSSGTPGSTSKE